MPAKKPTPKPLSLNEEQQAVVSAREGYWCCLAGPGSGKSACVVARFSELIKEGISPDEILSLSFTKVAAKNLRDRVEARVGKLNFNRTAGAVTFHSLALKFAEEERNEFGFELADFPLATEPVANKLSSTSARRFDVDSRRLRAVASLYRRKRVGPTQAVRDAENHINAQELKLALAYKDYCKRQEAEGLLDFDSLMYHMVEILSKKKEVRLRWQFSFIMADESQDNCITDWQLLKLLSEKHGNLLCVGDPGQSVFGFRGASPKLFLDMEEMFPGTQKLYLATNYRSTSDLVEFLKKIGPIPSLAEKFHTPNASGSAPVVKGFLTPGSEAEWVVSQIKEIK